MHRPGYCSSACKYAAQKRRDQLGQTKRVGHKDGEYRECPICGKIYHVTPYFISKGWKQFCSRECQLESTTTIYKCEQCGKEIQGTKSDNQRFCSRECTYKWLSEYNRKSDKEFRICKWCGKEFEMWYMGAKGRAGEVKEGQFCSRKCRGAYRKNKSGWFEVNGIRGKKGDSCNVYFRKCKECGKLFTASGSRYPKACSKECAIERQRKKTFNINVARKGIKEIKCRECGEVFIPKYGVKRRVFCSDKCLHRYQQKSGGGGCHRKRARYYGVEYEYINVFKVFRRDGWHCQICGKATPKKNRGTCYPNAPELDHRIPMSKGGGHLYSNVQCVCRRCNGQKSNNNEFGQLPLFEVNSMR